MKKMLVVAVAVAAMIFGVVAYANAVNPGTLTATARTAAKIDLTIPVTNADFAVLAGQAAGTGIDPDHAAIPWTPSVSVKSNKDFDLDGVWTPDSGFTTDWADKPGELKTGGIVRAYDPTITFTPTWDLTADTEYTATLVITGTTL